MGDISVILTVWKRDNLDQQLALIQDQTADVDEIYVYQNESHIDISPLKEKYQFNHIHSKDVNFKFHGRFSLPLLFNTKYTAIFDDDTMPHKRWLEHCKELCADRDCIVGANGRNCDGTGHGLCDGKFNNEPIKCDIVGHCWFFKTEWIHYMWREKPLTYENGEDIHFCATCQIYGGIDSYLPSQPYEDHDVWGDSQPHLGADEVATWRTDDHNFIRNELYEYWKLKGWSTT